MQNKKKTKQPVKTSEDALKEYLAKYDWLWENNAPMAWEERTR